MARGVVYIYKTGIDIYVPTLASVVRFAFPAGSVQDMDVLLADQVDAALKAALTTSKIVPPMSFVILLSDAVLFVKDFPKPMTTPSPPPVPTSTQPAGSQPATNPAPVPAPPKPIDPAVQKKMMVEQDAQIQSFLDKVPFENVGSTILPTDTSRKVVAANKALYSVVKNSLVKSGFVVEGVVPAPAFLKLNLTSGLPADSAREVLTHNEVLHNHDLSRDPNVHQPAPIDPKTGKEKPSNTRAYIGLGVIGILFIFMIVLYYMMYIAPKKPAAKATPKRPATAATKVSPMISVSPVASEAAIPLSTFAVEIRGAGASRSAQIQTRLRSDGMTNVKLVASNTTVTNPFIVFSSNIPPTVRQQVLNIVSSFYSNATSQVSAVDTNKIIINLSK